MSDEKRYDKELVNRLYDCGFNKIFNNDCDMRAECEYGKYGDNCYKYLMMEAATALMIESGIIDNLATYIEDKIRKDVQDSIQKGTWLDTESGEKCSVCHEIEPERKKGMWNTIQGDIVVCSVCGMSAPETMTGCLINRHLEPEKTNFCPNCGADMRGNNQ